MTSNTFRSASERLRADTYRLVQERDQLTNKEQAHSSKNIGDRVSDIDFWKSELRHETDLLVGETNALTEVKIYIFNLILPIRQDEKTPRARSPGNRVTTWYRQRVFVQSRQTRGNRPCS